MRTIAGGCALVLAGGCLEEQASWNRPIGDAHPEGETVSQPLDTALRAREALYGDVAVGPYAELLGEKAIEELGGREALADAVTLLPKLEAPIFAVSYREIPVYWGLVARCRIAAGYAKSARSATDRMLALAKLDARQTHAAWILRRELGVHPGKEESDRVLGVIVEIGQETGLAMIAGFADGTAKAVVGTGSGVAFDRGDEILVENAAKRLVDAVLPCVHRMRPQREHPLPRRGRARFVALTPGGTRVADLDVDAIAESPLADAFVAQSELLAALMQMRR